MKRKGVNCVIGGEGAVGKHIAASGGEKVRTEKPQGIQRGAFSSNGGNLRSGEKNKPGGGRPRRLKEGDRGHIYKSKKRGPDEGDHSPQARPENQVNVNVRKTEPFWEQTQGARIPH